METSAALGFALVAFTLIAVPGPDWACVLAAGARDRVVAPVVVGLLLGYAAITVVVAVGVGQLVTAIPAAMIGLTVAGAAYLIYLGIRTLQSPAHLYADDTASSTSTWHYVVRGAGVSALNPKGLLIFLSILPQFAHQGGSWPLSVQLLALGGIFIAICAAFYLPLGHAASTVVRARPRVAQVTTKIAGLAMIGVGLALLAERIVEASHS